VDWLIRALRVASLRSYSRVAQVVEQVTVNHRVGGSSPSSGAVLGHDLEKAGQAG
jgi:hypothetical protein